MDGRLYRGVDQAHPEIGHHVVEPSGPPSCCGLPGCWEELAAGPAMVHWFKSQAPADHPHRNNPTAKRIFKLAAKGDGLALSAVKRETYYLGLGLANLINLFTPDAIVLGGSIMKSSDLFLEGVREIMRQACSFVPFEKTKFILASLGEDADLIGAARVWHHRFKQGDECAA